MRRGNRESGIVESLVPTICKLKRLRLALFTDACLALASGTTRDLFENVLPSEHGFWAPLTAQLDQLESRFRKEIPTQQIKGIRAGIVAYTEVLQGLVGRVTPVSSIELGHKERLHLPGQRGPGA